MAAATSAAATSLAIRRTESTGRRAIASSRSTRRPRDQSSKQPTGMPLEDDQEATDGIDRRRRRASRRQRSRPRSLASEACHPRRAPRRRARRRAPGGSPTRPPRRPGATPLRGGSAGWRLRLATPSERPADQAGEDDDGRRGRVPAPRAELDDSLARPPPPTASSASADRGRAGRADTPSVRGAERRRRRARGREGRQRRVCRGTGPRPRLSGRGRSRGRLARRVADGCVTATTRERAEAPVRVSPGRGTQSLDPWLACSAAVVSRRRRPRSGARA